MKRHWQHSNDTAGEDEDDVGALIFYREVQAEKGRGGGGRSCKNTSKVLQPINDELELGRELTPVKNQSEA